MRQYPVALDVEADVLADLTGVSVIDSRLTCEIDSIGAGLVGLGSSRASGVHSCLFFRMPATARTRTARNRQKSVSPRARSAPLGPRRLNT